MSTASGIRSVSPWRLLAALLLLAAVACGVIAAVIWKDFGTDGVYLNRSIGAPAYSGVFSPADVTASRILLGAAIGLAVAGVLVLATSLIRARRQRPRPPAPAGGRGR
jgi:hypothetical protein